MRMHPSKSSGALLALTLPTATMAVSLSDFTPRVSDLPEACDAVYRSKVDCQGTDFDPRSSCSKACIRSLQNIVPMVEEACGNENIGEGNIIYQFLNGNGPSSLCNNANSMGAGGSSASSSSARTTTMAASSSRTSSSSMAPSTETPSSSENSTSTAVLSGTATATSLAPSDTASSSGGLLVDTSSATSSPPSTTTYGGQSNDNPSNGGSPFDSVNPGMSAAAALSQSSATILLISAPLLAALLR